MDATPDQISSLLQLQQADLALMKARKDFDALPQRAQIQAAREKRAQVLKKQEQVEQLRRGVEAAISKLEDEDASLLVKQNQVQTAIDEAKGDYRNVEARTKELSGISKRRGTLEEELVKQGDELAKIEAVAAQVDKALAALQQQEEAATAEFQKQGGALRGIILKLEAGRAQVAEQIDEQLVARYEAIASRSGGVGIGKLEGAKCGVCRVPIDEGRMAELHRQAPLAACPHCKRLLVIE